MALSVPHRALLDELLEFVTRPEYAAELLAGRTDYVYRTGEVFDEDRSFEPRMQGFLDWFLFDRPLAPHDEPPVRAYRTTSDLDPTHRLRLRILGRTIHGIFEVRSHKKDELRLTNLLTSCEYRVALEEQVAGLNRGELFEGRLIPCGGLHLSTALIFHPRDIRADILREVRQQHRLASATPVQDLIFMLSRMANRAEHYRNVRLESIYDFDKPPPMVGPATLRFDRESVRKRLTEAA